MRFWLGVVIVFFVLFLANVYYIGSTIYPPIEYIPFSPADIVERRLNKIPIEERVGQMLFVGFQGSQVSPSLEEYFREIKPGGFILYGATEPNTFTPSRNILTTEQTITLTSTLSDVATTSQSIKPFIASDIEGGRINHLRYLYKEIPSAEEMGEGSADGTRDIAFELGIFMKGVGLNMNLAPVLDIRLEETNPAIALKKRSFSVSPGIVALHSLAFISGMHENGIATVVKHFPGQGSATGDTHLRTVDVTETYDKVAELEPYKLLFKNDYHDAIMTSHITNLETDELPASLSGAFINGWLRNELGFDGVVISDDLTMRSITDNYPLEEAVILSLEAGVDMFVFSNQYNALGEQNALLARDAILEAVASGRISTKRINESYVRIIDLKERYGLAD